MSRSVLVPLIAASIGTESLGAIVHSSPSPHGVYVHSAPLKRIDDRSPDHLPGYETESDLFKAATLPTQNAIRITSRDGTEAMYRSIVVDGIPLHRPTGIASHGDEVVVADTGNRRIVRMRVNTDDLSLTDFRAIAHRDFRRPIGIALSRSGDVFVADSWSDTVLTFDTRDAFIGAIGKHGSQRGFLSGPMGLALHENELFVADSRNSRIKVFDAQSGQFLYEWGLHVIRPHEGDGRLHYPADVAVFDDGEIAIVTEPWEDRLQVFRRRVLEADVIPERVPLGADDFVHFGEGIHAYSRLLAITDPDTHTVRIFDLSLEKPVLIGVLGGNGTASHQFIAPSSVAFIPPSDSQPLRLAVCDQGNARLSLFSLDWAPDEPLRFRPSIARFSRGVDFRILHGQSGMNAGTRPIDPVSVVSLSGGYLAVLDGANGAVWTLDYRFRPVSRIDLPAPINGPSLWSQMRLNESGGLLCMDQAAGRLVKVGVGEDAKMEIAAELDFSSISVSDAISTSEGLVVVDTFSHQIVKLDADGIPQYTIGRAGLAAGEFFKPTSIILLPDGRYAVIDRGNHRLQIFDADWTLATIDGPRLYIAPAQLGAMAHVRILGEESKP